MRQSTSVIALNGAACLFMFGVGMIVALLPQRIINLSGSVAEVGYLAAAFAAPYILFQLPIGRLADTFGFKLFLSGGYFLCALTGFLYYFAETPKLIFCGRMFQGIGEAPIWALAPALLAVQFPLQKGKMMGFYNASIHLGLTGGSVVGMFLARVWQGNEAFLLFASGSLIGGVLILFLVENPCQTAFDKTLQVDYRQLLTLLNAQTNRIVFAGIMLYGAGYGIFLTMIPAFLIEVKGTTPTFVGLVFTLFYIAISMAQLVAGPWVDRKEPRTPMAAGMLMTALGLGGFGQCSQSWLNSLLLLASFGLGVFGVAALTFLNDHVSNALKGTISGAFYVSWGLGYFLAPLMLGKFSQNGNFSYGFFMLASGFFLEAIALRWVGERNLKEAPKFKDL